MQGHGNRENVNATPNPAVERTCAKSRAVRSLLRWTKKERTAAMPRVRSLMRPAGMLIMSLRHGPHARGRRTFDVSAEETAQLAAASGLRCVLNVETESAGELNRLAPLGPG
jgi:pyruvate/2-oxoglutarate dehydrogenase complex dihydrolipoamide acyltransferase (E2) component